MKQNLKQTARKRLAAMALFLLICLPFSLAQAQTIKVNGRVTDDLNEPMIGVSIFEMCIRDRICPPDADFSDEKLQAWLRNVIEEALRRNAKIVLPPRCLLYTS